MWLHTQCLSEAQGRVGPSRLGLGAQDGQALPTGAHDGCCTQGPSLVTLLSFRLTHTHLHMHTFAHNAHTTAHMLALTHICLHTHLHTHMHLCTRLHTPHTSAQAHTSAHALVSTAACENGSLQGPPSLLQPGGGGRRLAPPLRVPLGVNTQVIPGPEPPQKEAAPAAPGLVKDRAHLLGHRGPASGAGRDLEPGRGAGQGPGCPRRREAGSLARAQVVDTSWTG